MRDFFMEIARCLDYDIPFGYMRRAQDNMNDMVRMFRSMPAGMLEKVLEKLNRGTK